VRAFPIQCNTGPLKACSALVALYISSTDASAQQQEHRSCTLHQGSKLYRFAVSCCAVPCCAVLPVSKQVLISRKAGEAVLRGAQVFTPGVLGCSSGVCAGDTVAVMIDMGKQGR
jgi:predicted ribosome-associated RNA-binding protein Tma20